MLIKLGIIAAVSVGLLIAFSSEINEYFPNTATAGLDSFKQDVNSITAQSLESAEQRVDSSSREIKAQLSDASDRTLDAAGQALEYAEGRIDSATEKIGEELTGLEDASAEFVEENITEKIESLGP